MKKKFLWSMLPILAISTIPINLLSTIDPSSSIKDASTIENNDQLTSPIKQKSRIVSGRLVSGSISRKFSITIRNYC